MIEIIVFGLLSLIIFYEPDDIWTIFDHAIIIRVIGLVVFLVTIVSVFLLIRLIKMAEQNAVMETQEVLLDNIEKLFVTIRGQRHDFTNHVQVLYYMLKLNKYEKAMDYMSKITGDIQQINDLIKINNPTLSALLNTNLTICEHLKISFETDIRTTIDDLNIKVFDLIKILGNLINNAIDAVKNESPEFRKIKTTIYKVTGQLIIEVMNYRPLILPELTQKIFTTGYTTKTDGNHDGLGLSVVKNLVEKKYKGTIKVQSDEVNGTRFIISLPM